MVNGDTRDLLDLRKGQFEGIVFRGEDVAGQLLFVMGDFEKDTRTHHIHVVRWNSAEWNNYINFRRCFRYAECQPQQVLKADLILE